MRRSSARRGQTEPLAALVAVVVVATALSLYAGVFQESVPGSPDRNIAQDAADRAERAATVGGVVASSRLPRAAESGPDGYHLNVTLVAAAGTESVGPPAPATADVASRRVSVRLGPGRVVPGRLEVRAWT